MGSGFRGFSLGFRVWGIWGSYYHIPKAIFYLLEGDCTRFRVLACRGLQGLTRLYVVERGCLGFRVSPCSTKRTPKQVTLEHCCLLGALHFNATNTFNSKP